MTTITVEIDKDKDLSDLKQFIDRMGLKYEVEEDEGLLYTDELEKLLDIRYEEYKNGSVEMISAIESQKKIHALLASKK
jgi:hypothetical protein